MRCPAPAPTSSGTMRITAHTPMPYDGGTRYTLQSQQVPHNTPRATNWNKHSDRHLSPRQPPEIREAREAIREQYRTHTSSQRTTYLTYPLFSPTDAPIPQHHPTLSPHLTPTMKHRPLRPQLARVLNAIKTSARHSKTHTSAHSTTYPTISLPTPPPDTLTLWQHPTPPLIYQRRKNAKNPPPNNRIGYIKERHHQEIRPNMPYLVQYQTRGPKN